LSPKTRLNSLNLEQLITKTSVFVIGPLSNLFCTKKTENGFLKLFIFRIAPNDKNEKNLSFFHFCHHLSLFSSKILKKNLTIKIFFLKKKIRPVNILVCFSSPNFEIWCGR